MNGFNIYTARQFNAGTLNVETQAIVSASIKPTTGSPYLYHPVIVHPIGDVLAGDEIDVAACYVQVSSKMPYNLMVASLLVVTDKPVTTPSNDRATWGGLEVTEGVGANIDNNVHHYPVLRTAKFVMPYDMTNAHLVFLVYAASTAYDGASLLTLNGDYGRLEGGVNRKATKQDVLDLLEISEIPAPAPVPETQPACTPEPCATQPPAQNVVVLNIGEAQAGALLSQVLAALGVQPPPP